MALLHATLSISAADARHRRQLGTMASVSARPGLTLLHGNDVAAQRGGFLLVDMRSHQPALRSYNVIRQAASPPTNEVVTCAHLW